MAEPEPRSTTHALEHWVHWILLAGTALSALLLVSGLAAGLFGFGPASSSARPRPWNILLGRQHADPQTFLLDLGLLALGATPMLRVVVLAIGWIVAREARFAAVALVVLALLVLSLMLGLG
jgi:uncharacterized membrane protein